VTNPDSTLPGAPCWIDLFTSDPDKSRAFYGDLFGWTSEATGEEFGGYINFSKDALRVAGAMRNDGETGQPDGWTVYLGVDDAKATVDAAAANGGQVIVPAMDVGDLGRMAVVVDAGGAAIGVWEPGVHTGFGTAAEPNTPAWFELHTRDYDAAVAFYRTVFQWKTHTAGDTPEFRYTTLGEGDDQVAGIMDATAFLAATDPSAWSIYFRVDDTDAALAKIEELGGSVVTPAEDTPYGRLATAADSTGAHFKLMAG
jgi:predicted enzyme related to lactoylglutathione lyase